MRTVNTTSVKNSLPNEIKKGTIFDIKADTVTSSTHGFHKYPAKFIPQLPCWAIMRYIGVNKGKTILDPFCGSGTTLVEGVLSGNNAIGFDIDPLSSLISKVKTTPLDVKLLKDVDMWITSELKKPQINTFLPECETIEHWFPKETIYGLSVIRTIIDRIPNQFGDKKATLDIYDFYIICFSSIIRKVSYADDESQKTYVSHTKEKTPDEVYSTFDAQRLYFIDRISSFCEQDKIGDAKIINTSSSKPLLKYLDGKKVDLAITSPPYIKAIDYIYNQMVELFWIGDLFGMQTQAKQNRKKSNYVGNKQIPVKEYKYFQPDQNRFGIIELDNKLDEVIKTDDKNGLKHSYVTYKYFDEMAKHFASMSDCIKEGGHYIMVVGDSDVSKIHFNTATYLSEIASNVGFRLINRWGYVIKNRFMRFDRKGRGGKIDIDWVLDFIKE